MLQFDLVLTLNSTHLQVRFSIGAGDRQALQPPASATIPVTNTTVLSLFNQLGECFVLLFCFQNTFDSKIMWNKSSVEYKFLNKGS